MIMPVSGRLTLYTGTYKVYTDLSQATKVRDLENT